MATTFDTSADPAIVKMNELFKQYNVNEFNNSVMSGGGRPINIKQQRVSILKLILILIKILKVDYKKKMAIKKGGGNYADDLYNDNSDKNLFNIAYHKGFTVYNGDLKFGEYQFPTDQFPERDRY